MARERKSWSQELPEHFLEAQRFYHQVLERDPAWLKDHYGKYVAIKGREVINVADSLEESVRFRQSLDDGSTQHALFTPQVDREYPMPVFSVREGEERPEVRCPSCDRDMDRMLDYPLVDVSFVRTIDLGENPEAFYGPKVPGTIRQVMSSPRMQAYVEALEANVGRTVKSEDLEPPFHYEFFNEILGEQRFGMRLFFREFGGVSVLTLSRTSGGSISIIRYLAELVEIGYRGRFLGTAEIPQ